MFDCIKDECLGEEVNTTTSSYSSSETYPTVAFVMMYCVTGGLPQIYGGVFESEYDAQQYCIDNSTSSKNFYYYVGTFKPPGTGATLNDPYLRSGKGPNYPNYVYPTGTRHNPNNYWDPQPPYVFANESDASDFIALHNNSNVTLQYSIQNWIPANTYDYRVHGLVGHHNLYRQRNMPQVSFVPAEIIYRG